MLENIPKVSFYENFIFSIATATDNIHDVFLVAEEAGIKDKFKFLELVSFCKIHEDG